MYRKKPLLIIFEGIEGSGKTVHAKNLFKKIKKKKLPVVLTREPGGTKQSESIRKLILSGKKNKFDSLTDTLLYLAARNENVKKNISINLKKKKIIICDRFIDTTKAYQVSGLGVNKNLVEHIHRFILKNIIPDYTFYMIVNIDSSFKRLKSRNNLNRYDKFSKVFYKKVQNTFVNLSKINKNKSTIINTNKDFSINEKIIFNKIDKLLNIKN